MFIRPGFNSNNDFDPLWAWIQVGFQIFNHGRPLGKIYSKYIFRSSRIILYLFVAYYFYSMIPIQCLHHQSVLYKCQSPDCTLSNKITCEGCLLSDHDHENLRFQKLNATEFYLYQFAGLAKRRALIVQQIKHKYQMKRMLAKEDLDQQLSKQKQRLKETLMYKEKQTPKKPIIIKQQKPNFDFKPIPQTNKFINLQDKIPKPGFLKKYTTFEQALQQIKELNKSTIYLFQFNFQEETHTDKNHRVCLTEFIIALRQLKHARKISLRIGVQCRISEWNIKELIITAKYIKGLEQLSVEFYPLTEQSIKQCEYNAKGPETVCKFILLDTKTVL